MWGSAGTAFHSHRHDCWRQTSNVNLPEETIALLLGARAYSANQRVINAIDDTAGQVISRVGMPA